MEKRLMVYKGQSKFGHEYGWLSSLEENNGARFNEDNNTSLFRKNLGCCKIGCVYEFDVVDKSISYAKHQPLVAFWLNNEDKMEWRAVDSAYKLSKKPMPKNDSDNIKSILSPIKEMYKKSTPGERTLILAEVLQIIIEK